MASGTGHSWKHRMQRTRRCWHFYGASDSGRLNIQDKENCD
jgi:hypothetical protein